MHSFLLLISLLPICIEAFASISFMQRRSTSSSNYHASSSLPSLSLTEEEVEEVPAITHKFQTLTSNPNVCILIDMENVRGKTSFELDHSDLLDRLLIWTSLRGYASGRTIVVVDHGSKSTAHLLSSHCRGSDGGVGDSTPDEAALCVTFAGPNIKADDVIVRDVSWLLSSSSKHNVCVEHVVVITADNELSWRCRSAASKTARRDRRSTGYNSILRSLAIGDSGFDTTTPRGHKKKHKKGGRNKKSRSARKRQYMDQQNQKENEESTYDEREEVLDEQIMGNMTIENATTTHDQQELLSIVSPQRFLEDLEFAMFEWFDQQQKEDNQHLLLDESNNTRGSTDYAHSSIDSIPIPSPISTSQTLFELRGRILTIESSLRKKCTLHKRQTLTGELRSCKKEWKEILSSLASATGGNTTDDMNYNGGGIRQSDLTSRLAWSLSSTISSLDENGNDIDSSPLSPLSSGSSASSTSWDKLLPSEQEKLLLRWGKRRGRHGTKREKTEDRIVLAERIRRQLELLTFSHTTGSSSNEIESTSMVGDNTIDCGRENTLINAYAEYINQV